MTVRFLSSGDTALVVEFGDSIARDVNDCVLRLRDGLCATPPPGLVETVPTFRSLMIHYDPLQTTAAALRQAVEALLQEPGGQRRTARLWRVPVCYEPEHAPDLATVAERTGRDPAEVVALHSGSRYHIYMIGFLPGFPYMGGLPEALALPRRADPRLRVPAGAVAIATRMTAIYPFESPGGWHLIGATPIRLFDPRWDRPALFAPGDAVAFEPIAGPEFAAIRAAVAAGAYRPPCDEIAA